MVSRVLEISSPRRFRIVDREMPIPGPDEVVVRVDGVSTCPQWDMHLWQGEPMFPGHPLNYPIINGWPGHEMTGRVYSVGSNVTQLSPGDRVAAWCDARTGQGAYAMHALIHADMVLLIGEKGSTESWAPLELATCVTSLMRDLQAHGFLPCDRFGVSGLGPAGLIAIQIARSMGARHIIGFEPNPLRRKQAEALGCDQTYDPRDCKIPDRRQADAMNVAIDCVGHGGVVDFLGMHTRDVVAFFGVQREAYSFKPDYYCNPALRFWGYTGTTRADGEFARDLIQRGRLDLAPLCTHTVPLKEYGNAVALLMSGEAVKVCVTCDDLSVA